jgi:hypothetical protein
MARLPKRAAEWRPRFLDGLRQSGNVRLACELAGISRKVAYEHRSRDATFAAQWEEALEDAVDLLEAIALERARQSSDALLIFLLKAHRPDKYRDPPRVIQLAGEAGGPIQIQAIDYRVAAAALAPGPVDDYLSSGDDQGCRRGSAMGEDGDGR